MTANPAVDEVRPGRRGRPRDPQIEVRIFDAALVLYGRQGWHGFNLDGVAREARVSKDAMYRRWKTRETLLQDALHQRWDWAAAIDHGTVQDDLIELGRRTFATFAGPHGEVALQLRADARRFSEVRTFAEPYRELMVQQGRRIVRQAIQRGDLSPLVNPGMIMDLLVGSIINHIISTPRRLRQAMIEDGPHFIRSVVTLILVGAEHLAKEHPVSSRPSSPPAMTTMDRSILSEAKEAGSADRDGSVG